jgi:cysteine desulfurase
MRIYFDNAATTPLDPRVTRTIRAQLDQGFGNPSSLHWAGRQARASVAQARARVAAMLHAEAGEIIFTGSGTEADNLALQGVIAASGRSRNHLITSGIEHPAVLQTCRALARAGVDLTVLPADGDGIVDPDELRAAIRPTTSLVSIMTANNVVGTLQPIGEFGRIAREHGIPFHTDAVQAAGKVPMDVHHESVDLVSLSAHKLHGPQGVGALWVRSGVPMAPLVHGGGQEQGLRSATENVAGVAGFGVAAEIAAAEMAAEAVRLVELRDHLIEGVCGLVPNAYLIGHRYRRLPGHVCLGFAGLEGEAIKLLLALDGAGIAVSSGSACSARHGAQPSHVLQAMGFDALRARGALRVTLGRFSTRAEVDRLLDVLPAAVATLRPVTTYPMISSHHHQGVSDEQRSK